MWRRERACALRIDGSDAKRNVHYATTYGSPTPPGYDFVHILDESRERASADGVIGIAFMDSGMREFLEPRLTNMTHRLAHVATVDRIP